MSQMIETAGSNPCSSTKGRGPSVSLPVDVKTYRLDVMFGAGSER